MRIHKRDNYNIGYSGMDLASKYDMLESQKALDTLECFSNLCLFFQERCIDQKWLPNTEHNLVDQYGFLIDMDNLSKYFHDPSEDKRYFLINYHMINNRQRIPEEKPYFFKSKTWDNTKPINVWSKQFLDECVNAAIYCIVDRVIELRESAPYYWWLQKLYSIKAKYAYEIDCFDRFFKCNQYGKMRETILKDQYGLPYEIIIERKKDGE